MKRNLPLLLAFAVVLALPFALRPKVDLLAGADDTLVIVTPHNEAIRHEFTTAFAEHYKAEIGRSVRIDWRTPGGTSEIARYIESEFTAAFRTRWTQTLGRNWSDEVESAFSNHRIQPATDPADPDTKRQARRAFLDSDVGIRIDLFFGGGAYDFAQQARAGRLVDSGVVASLPGLFNPNAIPENLGGEQLYDPKGLWIGTCLSAFGIASNIDVLKRLGIAEPPDQWADLANPALLGQVAMADPTKSGSINKAFEMLIQQQMQEALTEGAADPAAVGWERGLRLIQRISGNSRYFTDAASKIVIDVALGDAAAGMCIDFYGRQQSEAVAGPDGASRLIYRSPLGGTSIGADPIGLMRGAPNREVAIRFIRFVLSEQGQKLWNFRPGTPGGPQKFALRRLPIHPAIYDPAYTEFRSDPEVHPYEEARSFTYNSAWTSPLFSSLRFIIRCMCLDAHDELRDAWRAMKEAGFPPEAMAVFGDVSKVSLAIVNDTIKGTVSGESKLDEVRLAKELNQHFREQYRRAAEIARSLNTP